MTFRRWADLKTTDFPPARADRAVAVLALAATEQHGPHLPLGTDFMIAEGMLAEVARLCPASLDLCVLPVQDIGKSSEHAAFPGTLSFSPQTMLAMLADMTCWIARAGFKKMVFVSSHGGNAEVMALAMQEARETHGMIAGQCSWRRFGRPEGLFSARENTHGIHGGDYETSLMLHFAPDLVDMGKAIDFIARSEAIAQENATLRLTGPLSMGWMAEDNNPAGVVGEAHLATAEKGRAVAQFQAQGFLTLAQDIANFPLPEARA